MSKFRTLEYIHQRAQENANTDGRSYAILNLNSFSPLYVIRDWDDRYVGDRQLVERVNPAPKGWDAI